MLVLRFYFWSFLGHVLTFWRLTPLEFFKGIILAFDGLGTLVSATQPARCRAIKAAVDWLEDNAEKEYPAYPRCVMKRIRLLGASAAAGASGE